MNHYPIDGDDDLPPFGPDVLEYADSVPQDFYTPPHREPMFIPKKTARTAVSQRGQTRGVSCPAELVAELRKYPQVNWSAIACEAWKKTLAELKRRSSSPATDDRPES